MASGWFHPQPELQARGCVCVNKALFIRRFPIPLDFVPFSLSREELTQGLSLRPEKGCQESQREGLAEA